ncbi:MAG: hypothetical protein KY469_18835 [Actinobacteria bacterium]|nr:hypothetical protein [Actinomycetota bacterium]
MLGVVTAGMGLVGPMSMAHGSEDVDYLTAPVVETKVLDWGHRPAWSPDGTKLAFLGLQHHFGAGLAYELDLATGEVRCLTCHLENGSVLRVYYLPDGSFLFQAPATPLYPTSPADTSIPEHFNCAIAGREHQLGLGTDDVSGLFRCELYWLPASLEGPLQPLGVHSFEEVAIDPSTSRISWVVPAGAVTPDWQIWLGDLVHEGQHAQLINRQQVFTTFPESVADPPVMAWIEVMDFFVGREAMLIYARLIGTENQGDGEVLELDLATGALTNHSNNPAHEEAHLFFPDDTFALNERDDGLWALQLDGTGQHTRRFADGIGAVSSPDGHRVAYAKETAGPGGLWVATFGGAPSGPLDDGRPSDVVSEPPATSLPSTGSAAHVVGLAMLVLAFASRQVRGTSQHSVTPAATGVNPFVSRSGRFESDRVHHASARPVDVRVPVRYGTEVHTPSDHEGDRAGESREVAIVSCWAGHPASAVASRSHVASGHARGRGPRATPRPRTP